MSYQVLARKWRPKTFDEVVGQLAVTRTLRNAITSRRVAHSFVFAGPRGCGKTTTARILAKALNCVNGPAADPCGVCDACVEIAQGRDMDVLEIDAASNTGIDNIREVVITGLSIMPARDRYKIFIIDEVHQLSGPSFNALLKSIEEPPAHVVFMMATTELHKIPDTILSRSQVFEFKTIATTAIVAQLKTIAAAEAIEVSDAALALIARAAEGSMRDAQSALDQVIAFAGHAIGVDDVSTVLGLVGRDLLFDLIDAVVAEDGPRAFALADRAVESGHDLKLVCRELTRVIRDLMLVSVDPDRAGDGELAEGERERLTALAGRFSREDLMRAFDLLAKAEQDIRNASQPRYHFEMTLLRWMHLMKLVPLTDLLEQLGGGGAATKGASRPALTAPAAAARPVSRTMGPAVPRPAAPLSRGGSPSSLAPSSPVASSPVASTALPPSPFPLPPSSQLKDTLLAEIKTGKNTLYSLAIAQAERIDVTDERITFTFASNQNVARAQLEQNREWIEAAAQRIAGRKIRVHAVQSPSVPQGPQPHAVAAPPGPAAPAARPEAAPAALWDAPDPVAPGAEGGRVSPDASPVRPAAGDSAAPAPARDLKAEALSSSAVQAVLDVFPAEIREVEEL